MNKTKDASMSSTSRTLHGVRDLVLGTTELDYIFIIVLWECNRWYKVSSYDLSCTFHMQVFISPMFFTYPNM